MGEKRDFNKEPIKATWPDHEKIHCKDCVFRDKSIVELNGKKLPVGITKDFCEIYEAPPKTNGKPHDVLFQNAKCPYYMKDDE